MRGEGQGFANVRANSWTFNITFNNHTDDCLKRSEVFEDRQAVYAIILHAGGIVEQTEIFLFERRFFFVQVFFDTDRILQISIFDTIPVDCSPV